MLLLKAHRRNFWDMKIFNSSILMEFEYLLAYMCVISLYQVKLLNYLLLTALPNGLLPLPRSPFLLLQYSFKFQISYTWKTCNNCLSKCGLSCVIQLSPVPPIYLERSWFHHLYGRITMHYAYYSISFIHSYIDGTQTNFITWLLWILLYERV